jgi:hypothetical protein
VSEFTPTFADASQAQAPKQYPKFEIKAEFPQAVQARLQVVDATVQANSEKANAALKPRLNKIGFGLEQLGKLARSGSKHRVRGMSLLRELATVWAHSVAKASACKSGCTSCCHTPVPISAVEAKVIGKAIKRHPAVVTQSAVTADGGGVSSMGACPFLVEGKCVIYKERPMLCRTRFNLDVDSLLCDASLDNSEIPIPYASATPFHHAYRQLSADAEYGDIREFFPNGLSAKTA